MLGNNSINQDSRIKEFTLNLAQAAASYAVFRAPGDILVEDYNIYVSTAGTDFDSVAIATNDTVPFYLLTADEGVMTNITEGNQVLSANVRRTFRLSTGKRVDFTLVGATGTGALKLTVKYRPISAGAYL